MASSRQPTRCTWMAKAEAAHHGDRPSARSAQSNWKAGTAKCGPLEGRHGSGPSRFEPGVVGRGLVIQIATQVRILVAIEAIDCRKGIDGIAQLCREKLNDNPRPRESGGGPLDFLSSNWALDHGSEAAVSNHCSSPPAWG
jgi:hypothetical protein